MLLFDGPLALGEFVTHEETPLAAVFREVLVFLAGRDDAVVFGAHAVNAHCDPPRMTEDVDVLSTRAADLAEELRARLAERLRIAARVREIAPGAAYRVYQLRSPRNRHLADVRQVATLPEHEVREGVRVASPVELVAMKVRGLVARAGRPKGATDLADLRRLLLAYPDLKADRGAVADRLAAGGSPQGVLAQWRRIVAEPIEPDEDEG